MAKMFTQVKFTAKEKRQVEAGWLALCDIADRTGSTGAEYLRRALKHETTGNQSVPAVFAQGLLCQWFHRYATTEPRLADLYGIREASILVALIAAAAKGNSQPPSHIQLGAIREAADAKEAAFHRRPH